MVGKDSAEGLGAEHRVAGIAAAPTPEADRRLLREVARKVVTQTVRAGSAEA